MDLFYRTQDPNVKVASGVLARRRKLGGSLAQLELFLASVRRGNRPSPPLFPSPSARAPMTRRESQVAESATKEAQLTNRTRLFSIPGSLRSSPTPTRPNDPPIGHSRTRSEVLIPLAKSPLRHTIQQQRFSQDRRDYEKSLYTIIGHAGTSNYLMRHRLSP